MTYVGGLIHQKGWVATNFDLAEVHQRFCTRFQGFTTAVSLFVNRETPMLSCNGPTTTFSDFENFCQYIYSFEHFCQWHLQYILGTICFPSFPSLSLFFSLSYRILSFSLYSICPLMISFFRSFLQSFSGLFFKAPAPPCEIATLHCKALASTYRFTLNWQYIKVINTFRSGHNSIMCYDSNKYLHLACKSQWAPEFLLQWSPLKKHYRFNLQAERQEKLNVRKS